MVGSDIQVLEIATALSEPKDKCIIIPAEVLSHKEEKVLPRRRQHLQIPQNVTLSHSVLP